MKLQVIINFFGEKTPMEPTTRLGNRVFRSISDFNRKVKIMAEIKKYRDIASAFSDEKNQYALKILTDYCNRMNARNKEDKDYKPIYPYSGMTIPAEDMPKFNAWYLKRVNIEIDELQPIEFLPEEIEAAENDGEGPIDPEELLSFSEFYNIEKLQEYVESKTLQLRREVEGSEDGIQSVETAVQASGSGNGSVSKGRRGKNKRVKQPINKE